MDFQPASPGTVAAFLAIGIASGAAFLAAIHASEKHDNVKPGRRVVPAALALAVWLGGPALVVAAGSWRRNRRRDSCSSRAASTSRCSSPLPVEPPLVLAFHLPNALIVPVCVGGALFGHVALTRALLRKG